MAANWILVALVLGYGASRIGLPPLVGFLGAGFVLGAFGVQSTPIVDVISDAGVLLLLFTIGLELRLKTLFRHEVWGSAITHLILFGALVLAVLAGGSSLSVEQGLVLAVALGFSSTVFAGKVLEQQHELRAVHGRLAIGVLIVQDLAAVALLAVLNSSEALSPWDLLLLGLPLLRPVLGRALNWVGRDELFVLFGVVLALTLGGEGFSLLGLSPELGALVVGMLLSDHKRAKELSSILWSLKEIFLVGFFLSIGLGGQPTLHTAGIAAGLLALLPLKAVGFFLLLLLFGLRARTSFLTALGLTTFSEFALIVTQMGVQSGLIPHDWLIAMGMAVAASFAIMAPINTHAHALYAAVGRWLDRLERNTRHPDDEPITLGTATIIIVGMGRVGTGAYEYLRAQRDRIVGVDNDAAKLQRHLGAGRRVAYADAENRGFWELLNFERIKVVMLAVPDMQAKLVACRELRRRGYTGLISATHVYPEELEPLLAAGCDISYNYYDAAGAGFARHTSEALGLAGDDESGTDPDTASEAVKLAPPEEAAR